MLVSCRHFVEFSNQSVCWLGAWDSLLDLMEGGNRTADLLYCSHRKLLSKQYIEEYISKSNSGKCVYGIIFSEMDE